MAFPLIMEALARVEHKIDSLLRHLQVPMPAPMHFVGTMCPGCGSLIDYQVDLQHGVVVRKCSCKTGKIPSTIPLLPITPTAGAPSGRDQPAGEAPDSSEREDGRRRDRQLHRP